jgi:hypothetical protein
MIVSHLHKFVFLKTRKTAGTTIEVVISRYLGPADIVTPNRPADERIRRESGGVGPQNHTGPVYKQEPKELARLLLGRRSEPRSLFWRHISAKRVRHLLGDEIWDEYFKFAFDRNPWDKVVSLYFWRYRNQLDDAGNPPISFAEFVSAGKRSLDLDGFEQYGIKGEVAVDFLGRYEQLGDDSGAALARVGIDYDGWLPVTKGETRSLRDYREFYTDRERELVAQYFAREIQLFGYAF